MKKLLVILGFGLVFAVGNVGAALITYDFLGGGPNGTSITVTEGGVSLTGYGVVGTTSGGIVANPAVIRWGTNGLGVDGNSSSQLNSPSGSYDYEEISFLLPSSASWHSVDFWALGTNETVGYCGALSVAGICSGGYSIVNGISGNPDTVDITSLGTAPVATFFAQGDVTTGGLRISSITIDAPVPEPSIIALFAAGLFGLGLARRRMRS